MNNLWIFLKWIKWVLGEITTSDLSQFWYSLVRKLAPANCLKKLWKWVTNVDYPAILWKITRSYQKVTMSNKRLQQDYKHRIYTHYVSACSHNITTTPSPLPHTIKLYHTTTLPLHYTTILLYYIPTNIIWIKYIYILLNQYELNIYPIDLIGYNTLMI